MDVGTVRCGSCGAPSEGHLDQCEFCGASIVHALGGLGLLRANKPQLDKAFSEFKKALKANPEDPDAHFGLGAYYMNRELYKEANKHLKKALEYAPIASQIYYLLGLNTALWRGWTNIQVRQHAERAIRLDQNMKEARSLLHIYSGVIRARSARGKPQLREALNILQKAKDLGVKDHFQYIYFFCGETLEKAQNPENALDMYRAARDFGAKGAQIHIRLGMIHNRQGHPKLALQELEKA
ncbi:MAG: tetratricopeptide repeat protein, partial [Elusimicrobiota bacterium]